MRLWKADSSETAAYSGREVACLEDHPEEIYACEWLAPSAGGRHSEERLLAASGESMFVWDVEKEVLLAEHAPPDAVGTSGGDKGGPPTPDRRPAYIFALGLQPQGCLVANTCRCA